MQKNNFNFYSVLILILFSINTLRSKQSDLIKGANDNIAQSALRFGTEKLNSKDENFVNSVIQEMDMTDYDIKLFKMNAIAEAFWGKKNVATFGNSILFGEEVLKQSRDIKRFIIGHELVHIKQNASLKVIRDLYATFIASGISLYCLKNYIKNKSNINIESSIANKAANWISNLGVLVGTSQMSLLTTRYFQRSREFDADYQAAVKLNVIDSAIEFLNSVKDSSKSNQCNMNFYQKCIADHPSGDARIERLEKLKSLSNNK